MPTSPHTPQICNGTKLLIVIFFFYFLHQVGNKRRYFYHPEWLMTLSRLTSFLTFVVQGLSSSIHLYSENIDGGSEIPFWLGRMILALTFPSLHLFSKETQSIYPVQLLMSSTHCFISRQPLCCLYRGCRFSSPLDIFAKHYEKSNLRKDIIYLAYSYIISGSQGRNRS